MLRRDPALRTYVWAPLALAFGVFAFLFVGGFGGLAFYARSNPAVGVAAILGYVALFFFFGGALFLAIAAFCSSWLWDDLSREVERRAVGYVVDSSPSRARVLSDSLVRFFATVGLAILAYAVGVLTAGIGAVLVAGWAATLDVTANSYLRRGVTFGAQGRRVRQLPGWFPFVVASGLVALIPFVNVAALPILVVAGTLKVARADR